MSSLACKCVFYRPERNAKGDPIELNFEGLEMQKWNIPANRARRVDEKNGVICLVIMFTLLLWSLKCEKWLLFLFFADTSIK